MESNRKAAIWLISLASVIVLAAVIFGVIQSNQENKVKNTAALEAAALSGNLQLLIFEKDLAAARARGMVFSEDGTVLLQCKDKDISEAPIPACVNVIGDGAFANCLKLHRVEIPGSIKTIGAGAFMNCRSLREVEIPDSVQTIGTGAFADCRNLRTVTIPRSVQTIGSWAFANCWNLKTLNLHKLVPLEKVGSIPLTCTVKRK